MFGPERPCFLLSVFYSHRRFQIKNILRSSPGIYSMAQETIVQFIYSYYFEAVCLLSIIQGPFVTAELGLEYLVLFREEDVKTCVCHHFQEAKH